LTINIHGSWSQSIWFICGRKNAHPIDLDGFFRSPYRRLLSSVGKNCAVKSHKFPFTVEAFLDLLYTVYCCIFSRCTVFAINDLFRLIGSCSFPHRRDRLYFEPFPGEKYSQPVEKQGIYSVLRKSDPAFGCDHLDLPLFLSPGSSVAARTLDSEPSRSTESIHSHGNAMARFVAAYF